jgi:MFS family permease
MARTDPAARDEEPLNALDRKRPAEAGGPRFAALQSRSFRLLWIALLISNAGSQMQNAAQAWLVRDLHPEPFYLGLLSLSFALPMLGLTPLGGALADRVSPRLLRYTQLGMLLQSLILAILTVGGWVQLWHILGLSFLMGVLLAMDNPARHALLPDLVRRDQLPSAVSLNSIAWSGSGLFGPALAGLLLDPIGPGGLFVLTTLSFVARLWAVFALDLPRVPRQLEGSVLRGVADGLRYAVGDRYTRLLLSLTTANNVLGRSYTVLMPIFARDVLDVGPQGYGLLLAAPGAGALVGGFGLAAVRKIERRNLVALAGWLGFSLSLLAFAFSRNLVLSVLLLFVAAIFSTSFNIMVSTVLQLRSPAEVRGRVMSLNATSNIGGSQAGGALSGAVATYLGAPETVAAGAAVLILTGLVLTIRRRWPFDAAGVKD